MIDSFDPARIGPASIDAEGAGTARAAPLPAARDRTGPVPDLPLEQPRDGRAIHLIRVPGLREAQQVLCALSCAGGAEAARDRAVLVPTRGAARQLRRTIERLWLVRDWRPSPADRILLELPHDAPDGALVLPDLLTRGEWYRAMVTALPGRWLDDLEREVLLGAACDAAAAAGIVPPFTVRPGLVASVLSFYDALRRRRGSVDDFERLVSSRLQGSEDTDRGAARLLQQTRFVAAALRGYEARLAAAEALDEHRWREQIVTAASRSAYRHIVVAVADQVADPFGLWPADFDLLTWLRGVERIDVVVTEAVLATGVYERLEERLPGIVERRPRDLAGELPLLVLPAQPDERLYFVARDREDEVARAVQRLTVHDAPEAAGRPETPVDECAIVFQRPLPYLYVGRQLLESSGVPYEATDALPLAAEPWAATLDVIFEFVTAGATRPATTALLAAPHLRFEADGRGISAADVTALDRVMRERGPLSGAEDLRRLAGALTAESNARPELTGAAAAATAAAEAAETLSSLAFRGPSARHLEVLLDFLDRRGQAPSTSAAWAARERRAGAAVRAALQDLRAAFERHGDRLADVRDLRAGIRRWLEGLTFAPHTGTGGLHLVDEQAARFGDFASVHVVGLIEGEWPLPPARHVLYPSSLMADLGWPRDADRLAAARASFVDLLRLARRTTFLSAFTLEDEGIVRPSALLEDVDKAALAVERMREDQDRAHGTGVPVASSGTGTAEWVALRAVRTAPSDPSFHGETSPVPLAAQSVTAIETYLACPFKYFASRVLRLDEDVTESVDMDPRDRGRFLHEVFQRFFERWTREERGAITVETLPVARAQFAALVDEALERLPGPERLIERTRLLGSIAASGLGERAFRLEAGRLAPPVERLLEVPLAGEYEFTARDAAVSVALKGVADRIDLLADGTLRVIDYKSGAAPEPKRAIQLPVYGVCAERQLEAHAGRSWRLAEAGYLAFGDRRGYVPVIRDGAQRDQEVAAATERLLDAVEGIGAGHFPPRPADLRVCAVCSWAGVCRKDFVDAD